MDPETREILRFELNSALLHFTQAERPVVLEGFGIVRPFRKKQTRTHHFGDWGIVREETLQTLEFEKCEDTAGLNLGHYPRLVDTRELVQSIYSRLPLPLQLRWSERELRRLLIDFVREVRTEVVQLGFSDQLRGVGQLFALHNRQGLSPSDWFAGADIFMVPRQTRPLSLGAAQRFSRPVLENAWELWGALLGPALKHGSIPLFSTLRELGFPENVLSDFKLSIDSIKYALFLDPPEGSTVSEQPVKASSKKERGAIFVTDGLRSANLVGNPRQKLRHELVVRVPLAALGKFGISEAELKDDRSGDSSELPSFVSSLLAAGSLLLASDRMNPLRANAALALGRSITGESDSKLRSLLLTSSSTFGLQQLAFDGPFNYATVLGLASDEAALLAARGREHLFAILDSRGLNQTTLPLRSSTLSRGYVELKRDRQIRPSSGTSHSSAGSFSARSNSQIFNTRPLTGAAMTEAITPISSHEESHRRQNGSASMSSSTRRPSPFSGAALSRSKSFAHTRSAASRPPQGPSTPREQEDAPFLNDIDTGLSEKGLSDTGPNDTAEAPIDVEGTPDGLEVAAQSGQPVSAAQSHPRAEELHAQQSNSSIYASTVYASTVDTSTVDTSTVDTGTGSSGASNLASRSTAAGITRAD